MPEAAGSDGRTAAPAGNADSAMSQVVVNRTGHVETVRLTAAERLNALTAEDMDDLRAAFRRADADPEVRCIVITGTGRAFCSGADVGRLARSAAEKSQAS